MEIKILILGTADLDGRKFYKIRVEGGNLNVNTKYMFDIHGSEYRSVLQAAYKELAAMQVKPCFALTEGGIYLIRFADVFHFYPGPMILNEEGLPKEKEVPNFDVKKHLDEKITAAKALGKNDKLKSLQGIRDLILKEDIGSPKRKSLLDLFYDVLKN